MSSQFFDRNLKGTSKLSLSRGRTGHGWRWPPPRFETNISTWVNKFWMRFQLLPISFPSCMQFSETASRWNGWRLGGWGWSVDEICRLGRIMKDIFCSQDDLSIDIIYELWSAKKTMQMEISLEIYRWFQVWNAPNVISKTKSETTGWPGGVAGYVFRRPRPRPMDPWIFIP